MNKLILDDIRNLKKHDIPAVDLIITSPPYWDMKNYDDVKYQIGHGQVKEDYLADIREVFENCFQITKDTGSFWLIVDSYRRNGKLVLLPLELAQIADEAGWKLRDHVTWDKQYSLPWHQKGQMRNVTESILFFTKSDEYKYYVDRIKNLDEISKWWVDFPERFNPKGKTPTNIWRFPLRRRGTWPNPSVVNHLCPFPTGLVSRIIELTTDENDLVMDPFAGSGVVLAQAELMGRNFVGFEINPNYIQMYHEEVKSEVKNDWEELQDWRQKLDNGKLNFEQTVMKLRALKFTRQITKAFFDNLREENVDNIATFVCITDIPEFHVRGNRNKVKIWIVMKDDGDYSKAFAKAQERMANPPLTHYEIEGEILIGTLEDFLANTKVRKTKDVFYLYTTQQPRSYVESNTIKEFLKKDYLKSLVNGAKVPPLLANIAEDVAWVLKKNN